MSVTMKREDELKKTVAMFGNQGGLLVAVSYSCLWQDIEYLLSCGFEQPAGVFAFSPKFLLNLKCRTNKAALKDNMQLLKFMCMELCEIFLMDRFAY